MKQMHSVFGNKKCISKSIGPFGLVEGKDPQLVFWV